MRLALLSDIHGNSIALDAVLHDIDARGGVDAYWALGDLAAIGFDPAGTLARLSQLAAFRSVRGNTDRYTLAARHPSPSLDDVRADPSLLDRLVQTTQTFAWTHGALAATGWLDWLGTLPVEARFVLPDGTRVLAAHASPGHDEGSGVHPGLSEQEVLALVQGCDADLVCLGHTHWPFDRQYGSVRVVNPGSVSNPLSNDLRASYALLAADDHGFTIEHHRVDYDYGAVLAAIERSAQPAGAFIAQHFQRAVHPSWAVAP